MLSQLPAVAAAIAHDRGVPHQHPHPDGMPLELLVAVTLAVLLFAATALVVRRWNDQAGRERDDR